MTQTKETEAPPKASTAANENEPVIPDWVNEKNFVDVFKKNIPGFVKLLKFEPELIGGAGENYASIMLRINVKVEVEGNKTKDVAYVLKTVLQGEKGAMMVKMMGLFPKESIMYGKYLSEFEQMYRDVGKPVTFAPKFYTIPEDPGTEYILLEDLGTNGFKNVNRLEGLDKEHTEAVLRMLAQLHAVSAVWFETRGTYEASFMQGLFQEESRAMIEAMTKSIQAAYMESLAKSETGAKYLKKVDNLHNVMVDMFIKIDKPDLNEFNVITHGDLWANNIMFRHSGEGKLEELMFIDFQVSRYASPTVDLLYFLISSINLDLKVSHFDYFVKYYHDHLVENLKLLSYPKKIISLKELRIQISTNSIYAFSTFAGVMAAALLDPGKDANMDNFMDDNDKAKQYKMRMYENPRYVKHLDVVLPWLDNLGFLD